MSMVKSVLVISALVVGVGVSPIGSVSALPLGPAVGGTELAAQLDDALPTIHVRNRGAGVAAGIIGGMILGGIIASQPPYYYGYAPPYAAYRPYPYGGSAIAYCMSRFKSYDPYSMTYLGYDRFRRRCP